MPAKILIIGASGQIGTELSLKLREIHGNDAIIDLQEAGNSKTKIKWDGGDDTFNMLAGLAQ